MPRPRETIAGPTPFVAISAGTGHACAASGAGVAYCWGNDVVGQLGDGDPPMEPDPDFKPLPSRVVTPTTFDRFVQVSAGRLGSCGTTDNGRAFCWGADTGNPSAPTSTRPVPVAG